MSELRIMGQSGDTKTVWDRTKPAEVEAARDVFNRLREKGYYAFSVKEDGSKGKRIYKFDPDAEKIILTPPMAGG